LLSYVDDADLTHSWQVFGLPVSLGFAPLLPPIFSLIRLCWFEQSAWVDFYEWLLEQAGVADPGQYVQSCSDTAAAVIGLIVTVLSVDLILFIFFVVGYCETRRSLGMVDYKNSRQRQVGIYVTSALLPFVLVDASVDATWY
jgi:hypothetical protein